jgi:hypothetical protein
MMGRHMRRIRFLKWTGVVLTALLMCVWVLSMRWGIVYSTRTDRTRIFGVGIVRGSSSFDCQEGPLTRPTDHGYWVWGGHAPWNPIIWWPCKRNPFSLPVGGTFYCPLWIPALAVALVTASVVHRHRTRPGHCQQCGYNLRGNVSGICPECGVRHGVRLVRTGEGRPEHTDDSTAFL